MDAKYVFGSEHYIESESLEDYILDKDNDVTVIRCLMIQDGY